MTCRVENGQTFKQDFNTENRLAVVSLMSGDCASGTALATWTFTYDGDGNRVKQVYDDGTGPLTSLYFMGGAYEVTVESGAVMKYYAIAGQTVAMDDGTGMQYLLTDHLGSVVSVLDDNGTVLSQQRYLPFGAVRTDVGAVTQTDFGYTFQRNLPDLGLMDYHARFYDSGLKRWTQPDSIVSNSLSPQALIDIPTCQTTLSTILIQLGIIFLMMIQQLCRIAVIYINPHISIVQAMPKLLSVYLWQ